MSWGEDDNDVKDQSLRMSTISPQSPSLVHGGKNQAGSDFTLHSLFLGQLVIFILQGTDLVFTTFRYHHYPDFISIPLEHSLDFISYTEVPSSVEMTWALSKFTGNHHLNSTWICLPFPGTQRNGHSSNAHSTHFLSWAILFLHSRPGLKHTLQDKA